VKDVEVDKDVAVEVGDDYVATVEIRRPPHNYFDLPLLRRLADAFEELDSRADVRSIVLASQGKSFCAGYNFVADAGDEDAPRGTLYDEAIRILDSKKPVVVAIQGATIGGGVGLAALPDFRVAAPEAWFSVNFARLGVHHGFGLTAMLPRLVGQQHALEMLLTGRRVSGSEALAFGLCDRLAEGGELRTVAHQLAVDIAGAAPLAVMAIRSTMRADLSARFRQASDTETRQQAPLWETSDFREGIAALAEKRAPNFLGR
jgi:enoyl-CoA hydratase/carnithine racemase